MADSTILDILKWTANQNQPEVPMNLAIDILEASQGMFTHEIVADADYTLGTTGTAPYEWQYLALRFLDATGPTLTGAINVICPTQPKLYIFVNDTPTYALTLKTSAGTGIAVAAGNLALLYCDGTNVIRVSGNISTT